MYNIDYTYLTELEVDTRQSFSDLSSDLLLVNQKDILVDKTYKMQTLVSAWQDYFWKIDNNETKHKLDVTFTDISIERSEEDPTKDKGNVDVTVNEMMTFGELSAFFDYLDEPSAPGAHGGKWSGNRTFTELCCCLLDAIDALHNKMTIGHIYPQKSIVISDSSPGLGWTKKDASYISENMTTEMADTELSTMGYHAGHSMGTTVIGPNLSLAKISPQLISPDAVPYHEHKLKFQPESKSGGSSGSEYSDVSVQTFTNLKAGKDETPEATGQRQGGNNTACGLIVSKNVSRARARGDPYYAKFNVSERTESPIISDIAVAPTTYPISASVWEKD